MTEQKCFLNKDYQFNASTRVHEINTFTWSYNRSDDKAKENVHNGTWTHSENY